MKPQQEAILAFESSCDETAVALIGRNGHVFSQSIDSQIHIHQKYGGVVPEVASRIHFEVIDRLAREVILQAKEQNLKITQIAATLGPGLIGPLLVASSYARGLAFGWGLPLIGVHHLRGHLASVLLSDSSTDDSMTDLKERAHEIFPALVLLVSGGHTQILKVNASLHAMGLIDTVDDAAGECFDKSAKLMGLPYPGGPAIEKIALKLRPEDLAQAQALTKKLPRPKTEEGHFSFSGLKTAIRLMLEQNSTLSQSPILCWAIQEAVAQTLVQGLQRVAKNREDISSFKNIVFCGGVSANQRLRTEVSNWAQTFNLKLLCPPLKYCTDNAAMIGACAWVQSSDLSLTTPAARLPLSTLVPHTEGKGNL